MSYAEEVMEILRNRQRQVESANRRLVDAAGKPVNRGFRNPGQSGRDALFNPTGNQRRALLEMSLGMLGHDPTKMPGDTMSKSIRSGLSLLDALRDDQRNNELQGAQARYDAAKDGFNGDLKLLDAMNSMTPTPQKPQREAVQYLDSEGKVTREGYATFANGKWSSEDGTALSQGSFRPLRTGRTEADTAHDGPKNTSEDTRFTAGMEAARGAIKTLQGLLGKNPSGIDVLSQTVQGRVGLTEDGRAWKDAANTATEFIGRALSGTQIKTDERGQIESMIVPTEADALNPDVAMLKLARMEKFTELSSAFKNKEITFQQLRDEMERVSLGSVSSDSLTSPGGISFKVK